MPQLLVTIVTPSFNQAQYIESTINSVLDQTYPNIEYLVIDGGSTDGTTDILRRYNAKLRWTSEKDRGQADAINKGFGQSHGQILTWLNSDDTLEKNALATAVEFLNSNPDIAMVYGHANFIDTAGRLIRPCAHVEPFNARRLLHYSDFIVQPAAFFRREAFETVGGLDPNLHFAMDYDLWLNLSAKYKIAHIPKVLANYRWLGENKSAVGGWQRIEEVQRVAHRHGAKRLPAYFRLEAVNLFLQQGRPFRAALSLVSSPRALLSLCRPQTWRIIHTGRVLRRAAAGALEVRPMRQGNHPRPPAHELHGHIRNGQ